MPIEVRATTPRDPLPPGRHKLTRDQVRRSQVDRLHGAVLESAAALGYGGVTVTDVTRRARVSRATFYEFFADKADCFTSACGRVADELSRELYDVGLGSSSWRSGLRAGMLAYLEWWAEHPAAARAVHLEMPAAGADAAAIREAYLDRFQRLLHAVALRARREEPSLPVPRTVLTRALVDAIHATTERSLRSGAATSLPDHVDELTDLAVLLLTAGPSGAD